MYFNGQLPDIIFVEKSLTNKKILTMEEILKWLQGPRRWGEGVALYNRYGVNRMFMQMFKLRGENTQTKAMLVEELRKLVGLTENDLRIMSRFASDDNEEKTTGGQATPTPTQKKHAPKVFRFRERFPFLAKEECPDVLKVLVADAITAYNRWKEGHATLASMADGECDGTTERLAAETVENMIEDRTIMAELDHYGKTGELLGVHPKVKAYIDAAGYTKMTDLKLQRALTNTRSNLSKTKKRIAKAEGEEQQTEALALRDKWEAEKTAIEQELERRKKK